jgi:hypothetical protein
MWDLLVDDSSRSLLALAEEYADRRVTEDTVRSRCGEYCRAHGLTGGLTRAPDPSLATLGHPDYLTYIASEVIGVLAQKHDKMAAASAPLGAGDAIVSAEARRLDHEELLRQCALVRSIFASPFRRVRLGSSCLTPTVIGLATAAYEERDLPSGQFDAARLGVLADALEEAGCADQNILAHLRGPGPHVRGCWPLDLILAK